jgi:hypothetical protein
MNLDEHSPAPLSDAMSSESSYDATEVRFGIRSMLIVMAVVAVVMSSLGAFIRRFPPEAHLRLAIYWSILGVILAAVFAFTARQRYLAESRAGRVLYRLVPHSYFFPRAPGCGIALAGTLCLAVAPALWVTYSFLLAQPNSSLWSRAFDLNSIFAISAGGAGLSFFWWRRIIVSEQGIIKRNIFAPWSECRRWYWDACNKNVAVIAADRIGTLAVRVPPEQRDAVTALLNAQITTRHTPKLPS